MEFKKNKCNSWKDLISGRDSVEEIPEINSYFQEINRGSLLYPNDVALCGWAAKADESVLARNQTKDSWT